MEQPVKTKLRSGTVQTIKDQLEFQLSQRPSWLEYHMPEVGGRGGVRYGDVEALTPGQTEAVRNLFVEVILYHRKRIAREKANNIGLLRDREWTPSKSTWGQSGLDCSRRP